MRVDESQPHRVELGLELSQRPRFHISRRDGRPHVVVFGRIIIAPTVCSTNTLRSSISSLTRTCASSRSTWGSRQYAAPPAPHDVGYRTPSALHIPSNLHHGSRGSRSASAASAPAAPLLPRLLLRVVFLQGHHGGTPAERRRRARATSLRPRGQPAGALLACGPGQGRLILVRRRLIAAHRRLVAGRLQQMQHHSVTAELMAGTVMDSGGLRATYIWVPANHASIWNGITRAHGSNSQFLCHWIS